MARLEIPALYDMHLHLRESPVAELAALSARYCAGCLPMPNLKKPLIHGSDAMRYAADVAKSGMLVVPTIYLGQQTTPEIIREAAQLGVLAAKLYPEGVTTGSESGVVDFVALDPVLDTMQEVGMVLCIHAELPGAFVLEREWEFVNRVGRNWIDDFPRLRIVFEHITDHRTVELLCRTAPPLRQGVVATITAHHLLLTLDYVVGGKLQPTNFCKPIAKMELDRLAVVEAATGSYGDRFMFGSDSAPHLPEAKFGHDGCAGCFTAACAPSILLEVFESCDALYNLEEFTSERAAAFWGLPTPDRLLRFEDEPWTAPTTRWPGFMEDRIWLWRQV